MFQNITYLCFRPVVCFVLFFLLNIISFAAFKYLFYFLISQALVRFRFPTIDALPPPILQIDDATFAYDGGTPLFSKVNFSIDQQSRIASKLLP
jgi:ABC-type multidrug transport system fused ATPase/permease subunit